MPQWISTAIANYGYAALFIAVLVEGPMATVFGAILASQGLLHISGVYAVSVAGDLTGDVILYGLGRSGRITTLLLRRRFDLQGGRQLEPLMARFRRHPGRVLVTAKLTHAAGFVVLLSAGAAKIPLGLFLGFNLLATLPKSGLLLLLGWFAGAAWERINVWLWLFSCALLVSLAIAVVVYRRRNNGVELPGG
ncbi:DedA family protein [Sodalis sp. RH22]|uniref:DedA family protein n=1 Tax=unclassified Sodalis (in: enterobacteria) TaxID=2636512 RepID=UPI0039B6D734